LFIYFFIECHEYCNVCSGTKDSCTQCIPASNIRLNSVTKKCTCKTDEDNVEKQISGKLTCIACNNCPHTLLTSATLKNEWTKIELLFTQNPLIPSNAINNSPNLCENIFETPVLDLFGSNYNCEITGNKFIVNIGQDARFGPDSKLIIRSKVFYVGSCDCPWKNPIIISSTDAASIRFIATATPQSPVGICDIVNITLNGITGIGNRPQNVSISYTVDSIRSSNSNSERGETFVRSRTALNEFLSKKKDLLVTIPGSTLVESAVYTFLINLKTFLGEYSAYLTVTTESILHPKIAFDGDFQKHTYTITENQKLIVIPAIHNGICYANSYDDLNFTWTQLAKPNTNRMNETLLNISYSQTNGYLEIPTYSLVPESIYELMLNASHKYYPIYTNASIVIYVQGTQLQAIIAGGDRSVVVTDELILDGSTSEDSIFLYK